MNYRSLSPTEQSALRDAALRRAHELRRQAIADAWTALFGLLRRLAGAHHLLRPRKAVPSGSPRLR